MNLNKKIEKFKGDGIPGYNQKINELIDAVNWLAGIRTINGKSVAESDQGPIIDLSQVNTTQSAPSPWANDPDGNQAGWMKVLVLNPNQNGPVTQSAWIQWVWTGPTDLIGALPWLIDPSGNAADWVNCTHNAFWGTGACSGTAGNFQQAVTLWSGTQPPNSPQYPSYVSPQTWTSNPQNQPIIVPASPPAFYLELSPAPSSTGLASAPCLNFSVGVTSADGPQPFNWRWDIQYQGTIVLSYNGSFTASYSPTGAPNYVNLDPTGWLYDPAGLPGYAQGSGKWVWKYPGAISSNTDPTVIQTFTYTIGAPYRTAGLVEATVIFLTA